MRRRRLERLITRDVVFELCRTGQRTARVWTRAYKGQGGISPSRRRGASCVHVSRALTTLAVSRATEPSTSWRPHHAPIPVSRIGVSRVGA
eukprot:3426148-Prymnesium_polylepis.2